MFKNYDAHDACMLVYLCHFVGGGNLRFTFWIFIYFNYEVFYIN